MALKFVGGYELDRNGNSVGVQLSDLEVSARLAGEQQRIDSMSASSDKLARIDAAISAGQQVSVSDLDAAMAGRPVSERVLEKTRLRRAGLLTG